jgi:hypothetical protein
MVSIIMGCQNIRRVIFRATCRGSSIPIWRNTKFVVNKRAFEWNLSVNVIMQMN